MKLLLDENLSRRLVPFLQETLPGSTQVSLIGLRRAGDRTAWQFARDNDFAVVTRDSDFEEFAVRFGQPPTVILIAMGNCSKSTILTLLLDNAERILESIHDPEIACVETG